MRPLDVIGKMLTRAQVKWNIRLRSRRPNGFTEEGSGMVKVTTVQSSSRASPKIAARSALTAALESPIAT